MTTSSLIRRLLRYSVVAFLFSVCFSFKTPVSRTYCNPTNVIASKRIQSTRLFYSPPPRTVNYNEDYENESFEPSSTRRSTSSPPQSSPSSTSSSTTASFFYSKKSFKELGVSQSMLRVLESLSISQPSKIQANAFPTLYSGMTSIVADQTGSGKTIAYLLPIIQRITEKMKNGDIPPLKSRSPLVLIVTPTTELATQVSRVVKAMANVLKFRTACVTSTSDMDSEQKKLRLGTEILVSTPGRLLALLNKQEVSLENLQAAVFDEADVLFMDQSFPLQPIGAACPEATQFIFTTATLPDIVKDQITTEFPDVSYLSGPGLHRIAPTVEEVLIDCSGPATQEKTPETAFENKRLALLKALETSESERTLIFCNTIQQCRRVENALQRVDRQERVRKVYAYHGAVDPATRQGNVVEFSRPLLKLPVVLLCTDRASRGMDFDRAPVDHVILFDFPQEPSEYVRRVGRTGRGGRGESYCVGTWSTNCHSEEGCGCVY